jgi:CubicO group peptidase (beta-lactamase class C family)
VGREAEGWYFAAGELAMTPSDLAKWDIAFLQKKLLSARSWEEFTREVKLKNGDSTHYAQGLSTGDLGDIPMFRHGGEVSGFLSSNSVFPTRGGAVVVLSNEDVVELIGPLAKQIANTVFAEAPTEPSEESAKAVQGILAGLQQGRIERTRFTANANSSRRTEIREARLGKPARRHDPQIL